MRTIEPISDKLIVCRARRVWSSGSPGSRTALDATAYLCGDSPESRAMRTAEQMSRSAPDGRTVEYWHVLDGGCVIDSVGPEMMNLPCNSIKHGVPERLIGVLRADSRRVLVHIKPDPATT